MPPVGYTARAQGLEDPRSYSRGISGRIYPSQFRKSRRIFSVSIPGASGGGTADAYMQQLRRYLDEQTPLIQIEVKPDGWALAMDAIIRARGHGPVRLGYEGQSLRLTYAKQPMSLWYSSLEVKSGSDYGGSYIDVVVPGTNTVVAFPGEKVVQGETTGRVVGKSRSDAAGSARIYVDTPFETGRVQVSPPEFAVAVITSFPDSAQSASGRFSFELTMEEAFEDEYPGGFEVFQPWR